ncbi:hypothetical protein K4F84_04370 [Phaeobacter inhibens]|uniref:hypothetical protein n=1 Tax=Phaeobacter inhibens TaxID=221822 RepID=UPI0021A40338|nr:hypothetical protein [Phaeobacter inhibens]UWR53858.1 hypothetical protein K4F84_04370 [Phaeobacter inhibens]UWR69401.1 hypothetical protein K4K95_04245 [Phaeobacter inhibens]
MRFVSRFTSRLGIGAGRIIPTSAGRRILEIVGVGLVLVTLSTPASAFRAINRLEVVPAGTGQFEVIGRAGALKSDYWCAAGDYVRKSLGLSWQTKIYAVDGIGASATTGARSAVRFTLDPAAAGVTPFTGNWTGDILTPGYAFRANAAYGKCEDWIFPFRSRN